MSGAESDCGNKAVFLVSYPRSGQHYTERLLERATGVKNYCEHYNCNIAGCPGQDVPPRNRPLCLSGLRFNKNHDFDLSLPISDEHLYAVFFRKPLYSITSYYERDLKNGTKVPVVREGVGRVLLDDERSAWEEYAIEKAIYWRRLILKWLPMRYKKNVRAFRYEEITSDHAAVERMFEFFFGSFDRARLRETMAPQIRMVEGGKRPYRDLADFRYKLDDNFIQNFRQAIGAEALALADYDDVL